MTNEEMRKWIDEASYESLLSKWRFAPAGDPFFIGEIGDYYSSVMNRKGKELAPGEKVAASKRIGF